MSFIISNEHIKNHLKFTNFSNAMNLASFLTDGVIFSDGEELGNTVWKNQWLKYCRIIMPTTGYTITYSYPFKSDKFKNIVDYEVYYGDKFIEGNRTYSKENAEAQAYLKVLDRRTLYKYYDENIDRIAFILDRIPNYRVITDYRNSYYNLARDLKLCMENKAISREWKIYNLVK